MEDDGRDISTASWEVTFLTEYMYEKPERNRRIWRFCCTACGIEEDGAKECDVLWCRSELGAAAACCGRDYEIADS